MSKTTNIDLRAVGFEQSSNAFNANTTSARGAMRGSQIKQDTHIIGNEIPRIVSGSEIHYADLQLTPTLIQEESTLLRRIPKKFSTRSHESNSTTLIYYSNSDLKVHYCDVDQYTMLNHGECFGYRNIIQNTHMVMYGHGSLLKKGTEFAASPAIINGMYCSGVNANTIFTSHSEVLNDGFVISQSLADKLESVGFSRYVINLTNDCFPLNIYGTTDDYRILPDIGEQIENETLFAYRVANETTCVHDLTMESLSKIHHLHDQIFTCPPGATIVDIKVHIDSSVKFKDDKKFQQLVEIRDAQNKYYNEILKLYNDIKDTDYQFSDGFNALVTQAMGVTRRDNKFKLRSKDQPIEFIDIEIVISYPRTVNAGNKLTDDSAAKGVIGEMCIWPDDHMPITESGIRADMIVAFNSPFNRLIGGPWYSQFINYSSEIILKRIREGIISRDDAYPTVLEFKRIVSPLDHEWMVNNLTSVELQDAFISEILKEGMYHKILPFSKHIGSKMIMEIMEKFNIHKENWSYVNPHTGERMYSKYPTIIGSRYVYLSGKLPEKSVRGGEFSYVNQFKLPMKESPSEKQKNPHSHTPIRIGVDETRTAVTGVDAIRFARLLGINGNSFTAVKKLQEYLLTAERPSQLFRLPMTTREILDDCTNIALFKHMMACAGYTMKTDYVHDINETNFQPYRVPKNRRVKIYNRGDEPALEKIEFNETDTITDLRTLHNFTFVDKFMKSKRPFRTTKMYFTDGAYCEMSTQVAIVHFILWDIHLHFGITPTKQDVYEIGNITKDWVSEIFSKIYERMSDVENHMYVLERLWSNINYINNFNELYCGEYNSTLCAIDIAETIHDKYMQENILSKVPNKTHSINYIESTLKRLTKDFTTAVKNNELKSTLKQFMETESLKVDQISQFLIAIGVRDDIDSRTIRHVITTGCFEGLQSIEDLAVESLSGKKSAYYGKSSIQDAGVFGKYTRNVGGSQIFLYDSDCGNRHTSPIVIPNEWKNAFINRRIVVNEEIVTLNKKNINSYVGVDVNIISAIHCKHETGFCSHCIGFGDIGQLKRYIPFGTNVGCSLASEITRFISQFILSSKHLSKTDSIVYNLPHTAIPFLEKYHGQGGIVWKKQITSQLRNFSLLIKADQLGSLDDIQHNIKTAPTWSSLDDIGIYNDGTGEIVAAFNINDGLIRPYIANPLLNYMKRIYHKLKIEVVDGQMYVIIPLDEYDFNSTPFKYNLLNKDMRQYVKLVQTFFNNKIDKLDQGNILMEAYKLIFEKKLINSHVIDVVLKSFRQHRIETDKTYRLKFAATDEILRRNISSKLQHRGITNWMSNPETFTRQHSPECYDIFFGF